MLCFATMAFNSLLKSLFLFCSNILGLSNSSYILYNNNIYYTLVHNRRTPEMVLQLLNALYPSVFNISLFIRVESAPLSVSEFTAEINNEERMHKVYKGITYISFIHKVNGKV